MNSNTDPALEQRKAFQPFVDVFKAAQAWALAPDNEKWGKSEDLRKACDKARDELEQFAIYAFLAMLTAPAAQAKEDGQ